MAAPYPVTIPKAFALDAAGPYRNAIPTAPVTTQRASFNLGFPPLTMTPVNAGGKPMLGPDMNGVLYMHSTHTVYQQSGQLYRWNVDVATAIGGYALGTILGGTDGATIWFNIAANNSTNPDAGGAGWVAMFSYGLTPINGLVGGVRVVTVIEAAKSVIVLSGVLVANQQIVLPNQNRRWLIVNTTTGAFTTTVKTASGSGVTVPQGGYNAPVEVWSDATNIYNVVAPVNLPIDQNASGLSIVQRTNAGYILATYFNQSSPLENFAISGFYAESGNDGYHRKISPINVQGQLPIANFPGQVSNAQVPQSAVTQHSPAVLASAALTGAPTAPTQGLGNQSTLIATTAFANPGMSAGSPGYVFFPGGIFMQWGSVYVGNLPPGGFVDVVANFPLIFNSIFNVQASLYDALSGGAGGVFTPIEFARSAAASSFRVRELNPGTQDVTLFWFAIGV